MHYAQIAQEISSDLDLATPPIAIAFVQNPPAGVETFDGVVPSACTFWRRAEAGVFYAPGEQHFNCPIGAMTMGFELPPAVQQELGTTVQAMCQCGYLAADEPALIPSVGKAKNGIVYGPLRDFPLGPDLLLLWLSPRQAMFFNEAVGSCRWTAKAAQPALGRPACAALPLAFSQDAAAVSFGCLGMRTFTEVSDDRLLAVVPGSRIEEFHQALQRTMEANRAMGAAYQEHKARFVA